MLQGNVPRLTSFMALSYVTFMALSYVTFMDLSYVSFHDPVLKFRRPLSETFT